MDYEYIIIESLPLIIKALNDERESSVLEYYDRVFRWRLIRRTPAKCLACGSTMVSTARSRRGGFEHPHCGGKFVGGSLGTGSWNHDRMIPRVTYSVEGIRLYEEVVSGWMAY